MLATVLIPVLGRPDRVEPLTASLVASETPEHYTIPVFLCTPWDTDEIRAVGQAGYEPRVVDWPACPGDYARKMNLGFREAETEWVFLGADDLRFHPGWLARALEEHDRTGACVVGTNDLGNGLTVRGLHSTHSLVHRDYAECGTVDDPTLLLHEGYHHNWVDTEFVATAKWRGTFSHTRYSIVEHLHPHWGKGFDDATYRKGQADFEVDRAIYNQRRRLWGGTAG